MQVEEYKRTCNECGKIWHSLVSREKLLKDQDKAAACSGAATVNSSRSAAAQHRSQRLQIAQTLDELHKCPNCGSANYKEELLTYEK